MTARGVIHIIKDGPWTRLCKRENEREKETTERMTMVIVSVCLFVCRRGVYALLLGFIITIVSKQ